MGNQTVSTTWGLKPYVAFRVRSSGQPIANASQNAFMLISDKDPSLAINAIDGARHNGPIALHQECRNDNPDCLWYYENGMLISARVLQNINYPMMKENVIALLKADGNKQDSIN